MLPLNLKYISKHFRFTAKVNLPNALFEQHTLWSDLLSDPNIMIV